MIKDYDLREDLTTPGDPNIASTDANLNIGTIYQQVKFPSLARVVLPVTQMNGTSGKIFCIRRKSNAQEIEVVSSLLEVYNSQAIKTEITLEAIQDIQSLFGTDAIQTVAAMLRGEANKVENEKLLEFLQTNCTDEGTLTLSAPTVAETNTFEISNKVQECVLKANQDYKRTYNAFCIMPYNYLCSIMLASQHATGIDTSNINDVKAVQIGMTKYYLNPDADDSNVYVGLTDSTNPGASCAFFGEYQNTLQEAVDPDTGNKIYYIFNRFGIAASPLHNDDYPMMFKFAIK